MIFTFDELRVNLADYNGFMVETVNAIIINAAAEYYKDICGFDNWPDEELFKHFDWGVDLVQRLVYIPDNALIIEPLYN